MSFFGCNVWYQRQTRRWGNSFWQLQKFVGRLQTNGDEASFQKRQVWHLGQNIAFSARYARCSSSNKSNFATKLHSSGKNTKPLIISVRRVRHFCKSLVQYHTLVLWFYTTFLLLCVTHCHKCHKIYLCNPLSPHKPSTHPDHLQRLDKWNHCQL